MDFHSQSVLFLWAQGDHRRPLTVRERAAVSPAPTGKPTGQERSARAISTIRLSVTSAQQPVRRPGEGDLLGKEVATASVLATTAKAAAPRVSVTQSYPGRTLAAGSNSAFPSQLSRARARV
jgi:hypothetical protein